jgi:hypothetical protein
MENPPRVGRATISDNYFDLAAHMTPIISNPRGLVRGSDWSGRFEHRKGMKPSRFLKSSPPWSITTPGELPFQEGRPLSPSGDEDQGQVVRSAKRFAPNRDDYDDYLLDPLDEERRRDYPNNDLFIN